MRSKVDTLVQYMGMVCGSDLRVLHYDRDKMNVVVETKERIKYKVKFSEKTRTYTIDIYTKPYKDKVEVATPYKQKQRVDGVNIVKEVMRDIGIAL